MRRRTWLANLAGAYLLTVTVAAVLVAALVQLDWYPAMGAYSVHVVVAHHFCYAGWVQTRPGHVVFRAACDWLG
jgi:hypothetical protein